MCQPSTPVRNLTLAAIDTETNFLPARNISLTHAILCQEFWLVLTLFKADRKLTTEKLTVNVCQFKVRF